MCWNKIRPERTHPLEVLQHVLDVLIFDVKKQIPFACGQRRFVVRSHQQYRQLSACYFHQLSASFGTAYFVHHLP
jgi:hypothetical protein